MAADKTFSWEEVAWIRWSEYAIDPLGLITPAPGAKMVSYQPFEFYRSEVPTAIVRKILSSAENPPPEGSPFYLHTLFASLDFENQDQVAGFLNHFGVPCFECWTGEYRGQLFGRPVTMSFDEIDSPEEEPISLSSLPLRIATDFRDLAGMSDKASRWVAEQLLTKPETRLGGVLGWALDRTANALRFPLRAPVPLSTVKGDIRLFKQVMALATAHRENRVIIDLLKAWAETVVDAGPARASAEMYLAAGAIMKADWAKHPLLEAEDVLETTMRHYLGDVRPLLVFGEPEEVNALRRRGRLGESPLSANLAWKTETLLSSLYLMLLLDLTQNRLIRKCANALCSRFFTAQRKDNLYCSPECQNRAKQRRHKARRRAQQTALKNLTT